MIQGYEAAAIRDFEAPLLAAGVPLMRDAARALAVTAAREIRARGQKVSGSTVLLLVGGGNNGGDVLYAGADLARRGVKVYAALCSAHAHAAGLAACRAAGVTVVPMVAQAAPSSKASASAGGAGAATGAGAGTSASAGGLDEPTLRDLARRAGVWLDGLTGIGLTGALRGAAAAAVAALRDELAASPDEPVVIATDVPSGVGDGGALLGPALPAHVTVTMGAAKASLLLPPARELAGRVDVVELGLPLEPQRAVVAELTAADVRDLYPWPRQTDHKYTRGVVGVEAGSQQYPGAGYLVVGGALAAGVGMVRYLGAVAEMVRVHPEVVGVPGRVQAYVLGSGMPDVADEPGGLGRLPGGVPVVLDAGALGLLQRPDVRAALAGRTVATPHAGELAGLLGVARADVEVDPAAAAREAAERFGVVVLAKGATTVVAQPGARLVYAAHAGVPWLASAGAGDTLAGLLGGLLAAVQARAEETAGSGAQLSADQLARTAATAAWLHGAGARALGGPVVAHRLPDAIRGVLADLTGHM